MNVRKKDLQMPLDKGLPKPSPSPTEELERRVSKLEDDVACLSVFQDGRVFQMRRLPRRRGPDQRRRSATKISSSTAMGSFSG